MSELHITYCAPATLRPRDRNPRTHSPKQIDALVRSIEVFGFTNPILIDRNGGLVAGHGRVEAAKRLGIERVPTVCLEDLSESQIRAYVIADNRLAEKAGWDNELLALEIQGLMELDLEFEVTVTGFETPEIDVLLGAAQQSSEPEEAVSEPDRAKAAVSRIGDLWAVGTHRILCGDSLQAESYSRLLDGQQARLVFTDPPYNVPINGHVSGLGKTRHREFPMASGEMSSPAFIEFLATVFGHLISHSVDGAIHYVCIDWRHLGEILTAGADRYHELKNLCVWVKTNGGMGSLYRSQHELVLAFKAGTAPHINNVELGRHGRNRTNVWNYAGVNTLRAGRDDELAMHPTVKPVAMVADAILDCSRRKDIVLDAFLGSGTTLLAAAQVGRRGYGIELDPHYVDLAVHRLEAAVGTDAVQVATGLPFSQIASERALEEVA